MMHDTIVALATGGTGALSVIRLSGTKAKQIAQAHVARNLAAVPSHRAVFTLFKTLDQTPVDEVLLLCFDHGKSFTGEETVEIHCHGSSYIQSTLLQALIASGARMAEPGEFTQRAFANGKMDLSQAEAVADLIASNSRQAHAVALNQMRGGFSHELSNLRDFGEEDVAFADRSTLLALVGEVLGKIQRLIKSFELGNAMKEGVPVAIVGAPNAGKSSLLNALLGEERAIVSDIPGTTRDVIEEVLTIDGIRFRLMDTAGIRATTETIEAMGIARSQEKIERARLVLALSDGSDLAQLRSDETWVAELKVKHPDKTVLWIANKKDLNEARGVDLAISALSGDGLEELMQRMSVSIQQDFDVERETVVSNARHVEALQQTQTYLKAAQQGLEQQLPADLVAMDLRAAMRSLGNITGQIELDTDILGTIFSRFCIGK
jgi:tRNA modification GTPase